MGGSGLAVLAVDGPRRPAMAAVYALPRTKSAGHTLTMGQIRGARPPPRVKTRGYNGHKPRLGLAELARRGFNTMGASRKRRVTCAAPRERVKPGFARNEQRPGLWPF
jgi:hypothetical protein